MDTKTNSKYWEKITTYFSNELNASELNEIELWAENKDGKDLLMDVKTKMNQIDKVGYMFSAKTNFAWDKLNHRIKQDEKVKFGNFSSNKKLLAFAAVIIIFFSIGFGIIKLLQNDTQIIQLQTAFNQSQIVLSDGSIVHLNGNSWLEYPAEFSGQNRLIKLNGEAYFEVHPDKDHPFIIDTKNARIQVLGTSFNVRTSNNNEVEVFVTEGKVRLQDIFSHDNHIVLEKGGFAGLKNNVLQTNKLSDINYLSWQTKMLEFNNTPLHEVINTLNRTYAVQIELATEDIGMLTLTSKYKQLEVNVLLDAMCLTFKLNRKIENNRIILY